MVSSLPAGLRRLVWWAWYEYVARLIGQAEYDFLNFGYVPGPGEQRADLREKDQPTRPFIELYNRVIGTVELDGARVLEVSCGRGGGAAFVANYLNPSRYVAIDRAPTSIEYCRRRHTNETIRFDVGDAEALDIPAESFDVVLNVEASHAYGNRSRFFGGVFRVLAPGGRLLTADFSPLEEVGGWEHSLRKNGFKIDAQEDITEGVVRSLDATHSIRVQAIRDLTPAWLSPIFHNFAGTQGSRILKRMKQGNVVYLRFEARRP